ncbi:zinc-binding alcohol dehydrogenase family protein [Mesorhizobium sp. SP-1A]|uniref:quinone oxidoreductase family protein n=1 Tax=Mesorhizobium sp. SP-1A TaxID=3077840 RepID=UPI0028F6FD44|nr:zinc-binding alcohol dehydrogenase family protein [Mesorhizobium sp. SP-1A]
MRAAILNDTAFPTFGDFRLPDLQNGEDIVTVSAAGINPIDLILARGRLADPKRQQVVPGREGVGIFRKRRVYFSSAGPVFGSMAELSTTTESRTIPVPDNVNDADAVAMGIAGLTAWLSLSKAASLHKGEHVLILGASGAVGMLAVQAARLLGAGRIIAAARTQSGLQKAMEVGANEGVLLQEGADIVAQYQAAAANRIDVVIDPIWGPFAIAALQAGSAGVRMIQIGNSAGGEASFNPAFMRMGEKKMIGFSSSSASQQERADAYGLLCRHKAAGEIRVEVETIPLSSVDEAWRKQADFPYRKLVLTV